MSSFSTFSPTLGVELTSAGVEDLGDIDFTSLSGEAALAAIGSVCSELAPGPPVAIVGGDNSVMAPAAQSFVGAGGGLITLDAHHDVRDYVRDGISNGSPVRQLIDSGLPGSRITQIGIKDFANSEAYASYAAAQGIEVIPLPQVREEGVEGHILAALDRLADGPIYVDVDIDVVDRALAPGAPAAQPGGLHPSQVSLAAYLCGKHPSVKALDVVEVDPMRDINATTVRIAALVILSFMAGVISR
jgi:formiminoglutamase